MDDDGWEVVEMSDDELNAIDPALTQRVMARNPDKFIASELLDEQRVLAVRLTIRAEMDRQEIEDRRPQGGFVSNYDQQKIAEAVVAALDGGYEMHGPDDRLPTGDVRRDL